MTELSRPVRLPRFLVDAALIALLTLSMLPAVQSVAYAADTPTPTATATPTGTPTSSPTPTNTPTATPTFTPNPASLLECPLAPATLAIDGNLGEWMGRPSIRVDRDTAETSDNLPAPLPLDLSSEIWCGWQGNDLIFAGSVNDDVLRRDSASVWLDDSVEVSVDGLNNGMVYGSPDDHQFTIDTEAALYDLGVYPVAKATAAAKPRSGGWSMEIRIPAAVLKMGALFEKRAIPFNTGLNDDDDGGGRDDWLAWRGVSTISNSERFGSIVLSGDVTPFPTPTPTIWWRTVWLPTILQAGPKVWQALP